MAPGRKFLRLLFVDRPPALKCGHESFYAKPVVWCIQCHDLYKAQFHTSVSEEKLWAMAEQSPDSELPSGRISYRKSAAVNHLVDCPAQPQDIREYARSERKRMNVERTKKSRARKRALGAASTITLSGTTAGASRRTFRSSGQGETALRGRAREVTREGRVCLGTDSLRAAPFTTGRSVSTAISLAANFPQNPIYPSSSYCAVPTAPAGSQTHRSSEDICHTQRPAETRTAEVCALGFSPTGNYGAEEPSSSVGFPSFLQHSALSLSGGSLLDWETTAPSLNDAYAPSTGHAAAHTLYSQHWPHGLQQASFPHPQGGAPSVSEYQIVSETAALPLGSTHINVSAHAESAYAAIRPAAEISLFHRAAQRPRQLAEMFASAPSPDDLGAIDTTFHSRITSGLPLEDIHLRGFLSSQSSTPSHWSMSREPWHEPSASDAFGHQPFLPSALHLEILQAQSDILEPQPYRPRRT